MQYSHDHVKKLMGFLQEIHTVSPWQDSARFFKALHQVTPFDNAAAFIKIHPETSKILPSPCTLWEDEASVLREHNEYYWRFKQPIVAQVVGKAFRSFHVQNTLSRLLPHKASEEYRADFWEKHKKRFSYAQYFKTRDGWYSLYLTRSSRSPDFSEAEQSLLDLLVPHLQMVLSAEEAEAAAVFSDALGNIICTGPELETARKQHPLFLQGLKKMLPIWMEGFQITSFLPQSYSLQVARRTYRCRIFPAGTGRMALFRITWEEIKSTPLIPKKVLHDFCRKHRFSPREKELVALAIAGKQRKEMAQVLGLSVDTVKEYLGTAYRKAEVEGKAALTAKVLSTMSRQKKQ